MRNFQKFRRNGSFQAGDEARSAESLQRRFTKNQSAEGTTEKSSVVPSALLYQSGQECRGSVLCTPPPAWELASFQDFFELKAENGKLKIDN